MKIFSLWPLLLVTGALLLPRSQGQLLCDPVEALKCAAPINYDAALPEPGSPQFVDECSATIKNLVCYENSVNDCDEETKDETDRKYAEKRNWDLEDQCEKGCPHYVLINNCVGIVNQTDVNTDPEAYCRSHEDALRCVDANFTTCSASNDIFRKLLGVFFTTYHTYICQSGCRNLDQSVGIVKSCFEFLKNVRSLEEVCPPHANFLECLDQNKMVLCPEYMRLIQYHYRQYDRVDSYCKSRITVPPTTVPTTTMETTTMGTTAMETTTITTATMTMPLLPEAALGDCQPDHAHECMGHLQKLVDAYLKDKMAGNLTDSQRTDLCLIPLIGNEQTRCYEDVMTNCSDAFEGPLSVELIHTDLLAQIDEICTEAAPTQAQSVGTTAALVAGEVTPDDIGSHDSCGLSRALDDMPGRIRSDRRVSQDFCSTFYTAYVCWMRECRDDLVTCLGRYSSHQRTNVRAAYLACHDLMILSCKQPVYQAPPQNTAAPTARSALFHLLAIMLGVTLLSS